MDTISRENNSMLPIGGIIVGALALILGLYLLTAVSKVKTQLADQDAKMTDISAQVSNAASKTDLTSQIAGLQKSTQDAFNVVGNDLATIKGDVNALKEAAAKRAAPAAAKGGPKEPVVAGPGEYVIKSGDTLAKVARANGASLADLEAVNPGVDSKHLHIGQKIKLPEKKS
jgi:LysM repeat protein